MLVSVFVFCHYLLFYGTYVGKVVGKATKECGCFMANVDIKWYVIFREKLLKWTCKFICYIGLGLEVVRGCYVILNHKFGCFEFSVVDNEFYLFLRFGRFNVSVYDVGYYLLGFFLYHIDIEIRIVRRSERLPLKIIKKRQSVIFNRTCQYICMYIKREKKIPNKKDFYMQM